LLHVLDVPVDSKLVVVACFANFLCDDVREAGDGVTAFVDLLDKSLTAHFTAVSTFCASKPLINVALGFPLMRKQPDWFEKEFRVITSQFEKFYKRYSSPNLHLFRPFIDSLEFVDNVHLTSVLGVRYVNHLVEEGWQIFDNVKISELASQHQTTHTSELIPPPEIIIRDHDDSDSDSTLGPNDVNGVNDRRLMTVGHFHQLMEEIRRTNVKDQVDSHDKRLTAVEKIQTSTTFSTDMALARLYEDSDFSKNTSRENRATLGSLRIREKLPQDRPAQLILLKSTVQCLINDLFKGDVASKPEVLGISAKHIGLNPKGAVRDFDIVFKSPAEAFKFRKFLGSESRKDGPFKGLYVSNCVTHSTKVRIDILTSIAKKITSTTRVAFCQSYISRPVLHVRNKDGSGQARVFTFVDAVREFGPLVTDDDLASAYRRAGSIYQGMLSRFFVILKEKAASHPVRVTKRARDPESGTDLDKNKKVR